MPVRAEGEQTVTSPTSRPLLAIALLLACTLPGCEELPNLPPVAAFVSSPVFPITAGQTVVVFNAAASRDEDGEIRSYVWDFGDGTGEVSVATPTTSHFFPDTPARCLTVAYTVQLTVIDDAGGAGYANQVVEVIESPPPDSAECQS